MSAVRCAACGAVAGTPKKRHNGTVSQLSTFALPRYILPHKSDTAETWQRYCKRKISTHARKHGDEAEDVQVLVQNKLFCLDTYYHADKGHGCRQQENGQLLPMLIRMMMCWLQTYSKN